MCPRNSVNKALRYLQMIHPGEYNVLKVWDYAALANALSNNDGTTFAAKVWLQMDTCHMWSPSMVSVFDDIAALANTLSNNDGTTIAAKVSIV